MRIGNIDIEGRVLLAPMSGISDKPFRRLCRQFGAALASSEMTTAEPRLWATRKSRQRMDFADEPGPLSVQIAGGDPHRLAGAARHAVGLGAQIVDINMGCPAKKVCNVAAGSALLRDELLVARILEAVVDAVSVPVTLKMRTGYARSERNALRIARIAEASGIAAITVHGRTREDMFDGEAEYDSIATVKAGVHIPVIANGDIDSAGKARAVLESTGCDAVMIGRSARGRPWIFREIGCYLRTGERLPPPSRTEIAATVLKHLDAMYSFYGEEQGLRIARKHLAWYSRHLPGDAAFRASINQAGSAGAQLRIAREYFQEVIATDALAA